MADTYIPDNPLIVQSDRTVLLEVHSPLADAARDAIAPFAELLKSPEHIHSYRISPLSVWNARAAGLSVTAMNTALRKYAKYPIPDSIAQEIETPGERYGLTVIEKAQQDLLLRVADQSRHWVLIIGEFIRQLEALARLTGLPLVTGKTSQDERDRLYQAFREGDVDGLVLSRVGNVALDLPDADVLIQVSGKFGSRQEEAQRLGRILRPKRDAAGARFYTLVSLRSYEEEFARHRQLFLTEQGYRYQVEILE